MSGQKRNPVFNPEDGRNPAFYQCDVTDKESVKIILFVQEVGV